jgi:hypothetical protein
VAVGIYRLLNTSDESPELEPIPDVDEAPMEAELVDEEVVESKPVRRTTRKTTKKSE